MFFLIKLLIKHKTLIVEDKRIHFINLRHVFVLINDIFIATAFFICKQDVFDRGFCHQQDVKIAVNINCSANVNASLLVSVVKHLTSTVQNYNLECRARTGNALQCYGDGMTGTPNAINNTFDIFFTFNYTIYAGHYLRINASCNDTKEVKEILLKPCGKYKVKFNSIMS